MKAAARCFISALHDLLYAAEQLKPMCKHNTGTMRSLCSYITLNKLFQPNDAGIWHVLPIQKHVMMMEFRDFNMPHSLKCELDSLEMVRHEAYGTTRDAKCSSMPAWTETCQCIELTIKINMKWMTTVVSFSMDFFILHKPMVISFREHEVCNHLPGILHLMSIKQVSWASQTFYFFIKTYFGYLLSVYHSNRSREDCDARYYDGPPLITHDIITMISKTHQLSIVLSAPQSECSIYERAVAAPLLMLGNSHLFNISNSSSNYQLLRFSRVVYGRIHVHLGFIYMHGQAGTHCEYGGFKLGLIYRNEDEASCSRSLFCPGIVCQMLSWRMKSSSHFINI